MGESESSGEIQGHIKWFDPGRGFGFIHDDEGGPDVLLHANVLRNFGRSSVAEGARIRARTIPTPRGRQAIEVLDVQAVGDSPCRVLPDLACRDNDELSALPWRPARVKWFDRIKGFGFANVFGENRDVFLHVEVLHHAGLCDLAVGEAVAVRVVEGQRGPMAAMLGVWDRGTDDNNVALSGMVGDCPLSAGAESTP